MQKESRFSSSEAAFVPHFLFAGEPEASDDPLPDVPIMLSTRLQLELLLQEPALDLRAVSEVILDDLGATLQILRLIGEEYLVEDERPIRIEDCVASLNAEVWFPAVCSVTLIDNERTRNAWEHAQRIGRYAEQLAGQEEALRPGEAQLVGLLHEVGRLPELLGWQSSAAGMEDMALGALLAEHWHLPECVMTAVREQGHPEEYSPWSALLDSAHLCAQQEESRSKESSFALCGHEALAAEDVAGGPRLLKT
jgi:HD-like signal output (HDOD) protein